MSSVGRFAVPELGAGAPAGGSFAGGSSAGGSSAGAPPTPPGGRSRRWRIIRRILAALLVLVLLAVIAFVIWARTGVMGPERGPLDRVLADPAITLTETDSAWVMRPAGGATGSSDSGAPGGDAARAGSGIGADGAGSVGLVFWPGAKVDPRSYAERLSALVSDAGMTVVIAKPWLGLALFDPRGLDAFTAGQDQVSTWMVGGHSMGGVRACLLAKDASALVLFASYCANDLSATDLPVLSLSGSEDGLSTPRKVAAHHGKLPADAIMVEIPGASHASFGDYGEQPGDGTPSIEDAAMDAVVLLDIEHLARLASAEG